MEAMIQGGTINLPAEYVTLGEMITHVSRQYPNNGMTFIDISGHEEFVAYPVLMQQARYHLQGLYQKGLKPGDIVISAVDNPKDFYILLWACLLGGIVIAPIHQPSFDEGSSTLTKLFNVWEVLNNPCVIIESKYDKYYRALSDSKQFKSLQYYSIAQLHSQQSGQGHQGIPSDLAILQFSSGSTGTPKGVQLTHKNIITNLVAVQQSYGLSSEDNVFMWLPHSHDMGLFLQYLSSVLTGSNLFILSPMTFVRSPYLFLQKISIHRGTWFGSPNFGFDWMTKNVSAEKAASLDLSSLKFVLNGAEPISIKTVDNFVEKFSACGFKSSMMRFAYGMAEATVCATVTELNKKPVIEEVGRGLLLNENIAAKSQAIGDADNVRFVRVGSPIAEITIRIADMNGQTLQEDCVGEIQIKGPSVTSGYYNRDDINAELFVDGWLRTGDLGYITDGSLVMTGRMKDIIFIRGQNFFAHDLEEIVFQHEKIQRGNLLIVGVFNELAQQEELLVFVKYKRSLEYFIPLQQRIITILASSLGVEVTHVIPVKSIPKTTSGKLQRFNLRKGYQNGEYDATILAIADHIASQDNSIVEIVTAPSSLQQQLRKIWSQILNVPVNCIGFDDEFLALGGNSIKSFQFLDKLSNYLNKELDIELVVVCKTINQVISYLEEIYFDNNITKTKSKSFPESVTSVPDSNDDIAITGMALRFPGAKSPQDFWLNLEQGKDIIGKISEQRKQLANEPCWDDWLYELENIEYFDNEFFEISPNDAIFMDPQQRLMLETSYEALDDAGLLPGLTTERNIGVYSGISINTYYQLIVDHLKLHGIASIHPHTLVGNLNNMISAAISRTYNFTGPSLTIDTACSSFLVALHHAVLALRTNAIVGAIVAGANILATPIVHILSRTAGILSSSKYANVFDQSADGSVLGEGVVAFYLENLNKAREEGKNIYGIIRGTAINNDGQSFGIMAPNPRGQYQVLQAAYADAKLSPSEIDYIEVHGTGTTIGDPIEINTLSKLFSATKNCHTQRIGIGSVKTNIGHLLPAAAGAGLAKILLSLKHKKLVPSLHLKNINPALKLEQTPFYVVQKAKSWATSDKRSRKAGLSSFGLGGTNAHIIIEEYNDPLANKHEEKAINLLTLSAKTGKALSIIMEQTLNLLQDKPNLSNLCYTRNRYRNHYQHRLALLINSDHEIIKIFASDDQVGIKVNPKVAVNLADLSSLEKNATVMFDQATMAKIAAVLSSCDMKIADNIKCHLVNFTYWFMLFNQLQAFQGQITFIGQSACANFMKEALLGKTNLAQALQQYHHGLTTNHNEFIHSTNYDDLQNFNIILNLADINANSQKSNHSCMVNLYETMCGSFDKQLSSLVAQLYVLGAKLNWQQIQPLGSGKLMSLPAYPFDSKPFWIGSDPVMENSNELLRERVIDDN